MKRIILFILGLTLFVAALNIIALPLPYSAARPRFADSPLVTPIRPTPTGWPHAPFSWQVTPQPREKETRPVERARGFFVPMMLLK
jgi:hypothetical protein